MSSFYEDVVGVRVLRRDADYVCFDIAEEYGGHSLNLALFDAGERTFPESKSATLDPDQSTLHHIALSTDLEGYESEGVGSTPSGSRSERWITFRCHVRSLYFTDPAGNLLELVCRDESVA
jgi:catechol-2,3-dioxygenase